MSRAEAIRSAIRAAGKPLEPRQIADACGNTTDEERELTYWSIAVQFRDGILDRKRAGRLFSYFVKREPMPKTSPLSTEERRLRKNERERARMAANRRKAGRPTAEQMRAARQAESARRAAERERERLKRMAEIEAERQQFRAARAAKKAQPKPRHTMPVCVPAPASMTAPPKPVVRFESVDSFEARGGRIQHLPPGQMAESVLRFQHNRSAQA